MKVKWGHFSDLHFQFSKEGFSTQDLRDKLLEKLEENVREDGIFDYLFITGDIFHKGENKGQKKSEVMAYIKDIARASGCDLKDVIICPGNHDLARNKARKLNLEAVLKEYDESGCINFNGFFPIVIENACRPFADFCRELNGRKEVTETHYYVRLGLLNVCVLNTAIFAGQTCPGEPKPEKDLEDTNLYICEENLYRLKKDYGVQNDAKLNIIIAHHGIECFPEKERGKFLNFIRDMNIDLYLCGHVHKNIARTLDEANGTQQFSCGGLFVDKFNSPSFIVGKYDEDTHQVYLSNYQYLSQVAEWREPNALPLPYDEKGTLVLVPDRLKRPGGYRVSDYDGKDISAEKAHPSLRGIKKVSIGFDRDKDFIEIRERAEHSITVLGVGMSKLSKYALTGQYSLESLSQKMEINLIMYDPDYLEENKTLSLMLEDFFGIKHFSQNVRLAFDTLKEFCSNHNNSPACKYRINLSVYSSIPTMSAVIIDEEYTKGEVLIEFFCYRCGQNRPLFLVKRHQDEKNDLFNCLKGQIDILKEKSRRISV